MAISVSAIKTAYDALGTLVTATKSAYTTLTGIGARPTYPVDVVADADYNNVTTAINTWDGNYATYSTAYNVAVSAQKVQEAIVVALMPPNQWVKLTTLANWGAAATQYIGVRNSQPSNADNVSGATMYSITTSSVLPTQNFPNV
jgi:hypothetical protein